MKIKKNINYEIIYLSNTKFSKLIKWISFGRQLGELLMPSWELKG